MEESHSPEPNKDPQLGLWFSMELAWHSYWKFWFDNGLHILTESWWILWGIILPLAAIITEKWTEICARTFFDPTPTDWHLLLFAIIPITNLFAELARIKKFAPAMSWVRSSWFKWLNGMAIGVSAFYAVWFLPLSMICLILSTIYICVLVAVLVFLLVFSVFHPFKTFSQILFFVSTIFTQFSFQTVAGLFYTPLIIAALGGLLLLPLVPLMCCLTCYRTRTKLFEESITEMSVEKMNVEAINESKQNIIVGNQVMPFFSKWFVAPIGLLAYGIVFYFMIFQFWLSYVGRHDSLIHSKIFGHDSLIVFGVPFIFLFAILYPSPISAMSLWRSTFSPVNQNNASSKNQKISKTRERLFLPIACTLLLLVLIEVPSTATRVAESMILEPDKSVQGLLILRAFGNEDSMLRMCYEKSHATDILGSILTWNKPVPKEKARQIFYQATGKPFNSVNIPASFRGKGLNFSDWQLGDEDDVFDSDAELAGETVGGVVRGVTLSNSEIIGDIDVPAKAANIRWDMEFNNTSQYQHEARVQILVPPNAVVSDVLLWENGQPQPAAFGPRGLTRAAYKAVVVEKRDPLLVTTYGPDRVLAQCFPVPPKGNMHIRIGITAPLLLSSNNDAYLTLPIFLERNFQVAKHWIKVTANGKISNPAQVLQSVLKQNDKDHTRDHTKNSGGSAFMGTVSNADLSQGKGTIKVEYLAKAYPVWSKDNNSGHYILQTISTVSTRRPNKLVVVVDGSAAMAHDAEQIEKCLAKIPKNIDVTLLRAGDKIETIIENLSNSQDSKWHGAMQTLRSQTYVGGQDDTKALIKAADLIGNDQNGAVLWLHGPQPVKIENPENLADKLNVYKGLRLYELQMENGPNRTAEALDGITNIVRLPVVISPEETLSHLFSTWTNNVRDLQPSYSRVTTLPYKNASYESQIDLSPLWANQTICPLRWSNSGGINYAVQTATLYRVVTPVSGAVVLENQADYKRFGLDHSKRTLKEYQLSKSGSSTTAHSAASFLNGKAFESRKAELAQNLTEAPDAKAVPEPDNWLLALVVFIFGLLFIVKKKILAVKYEH